MTIFADYAAYAKWVKENYGRGASMAEYNAYRSTVEAMLAEANADAERLAAELEEMCEERDQVCFEEFGENSPALIQHKNRINRHE